MEVVIDTSKVPASNLLDRFSSSTRAAMYMLGSTMAFAIMTALVKALRDFPVGQILFFRCFSALLFPLAYLVVRRQLAVLKTNRFRLHGLRAALGLSAMYCYFSSFVRLPLVEAHAFGRSKAIFIALFALVFLKEKLTRVRMLSVFLGFIGVLIMLNPGSPKLSIGVAFALGGAIFAALAMTCVSMLTRTEHPLAVVVYFMGFGSVAAFSLSYHDWLPMDWFQLLRLFATGFFGVMGQVFLVLAYRTSDASYVGPFDYLELVWASVLGFFIWQELPTLLLIIGISIVVASQVMLHRYERRKS
ncbi:MAG: DMT family transporter [Bdellovibrionales bacterium]|nr:DMT family transporter [Bdellovibrionales bacterium]